MIRTAAHTYHFLSFSTLETNHPRAGALSITRLGMTRAESCVTRSGNDQIIKLQHVLARIEIRLPESKRVMTAPTGRAMDFTKARNADLRLIQH